MNRDEERHVDLHSLPEERTMTARDAVYLALVRSGIHAWLDLGKEPPHDREPERTRYWADALMSELPRLGFVVVQSLPEPKGR